MTTTTLRIVILSLMTVSLFAASGSLGKPRYNKEVSFNELVHLELNTILPPSTEEGIEQVITKSIINAMDMPNNRATWSLIGEPTISSSSKGRLIKIQLKLLSRVTGTVRLPEIPLTWLNDNGEIPKLGTVEVRESIIIGNDTQALPAEIHAVGGFPWDIDMKTLAQKASKATKRQEQDKTIYTTRGGLELIVEKEQLAAARIHSKGWYLRQARFNFIDRWGEPRINGMNNEQPSLTWLIGWLRIHAYETINNGKPEVTVLISRQDIEQRLMTEALDKQIFKLLDSDQTSDELWEKHSSKNEKQAPAATEESALNKSSPESTNKNQAATKEMNKEKTQKKPEEKIDPKALEELFKEAQKNKNQE